MPPTGHRPDDEPYWQPLSLSKTAEMGLKIKIIGVNLCPPSTGYQPTHESSMFSSLDTSQAVSRQWLGSSLRAFYGVLGESFLNMSTPITLIYILGFLLMSFNTKQPTKHTQNSLEHISTPEANFQTSSDVLGSFSFRLSQTLYTSSKNYILRF